MDEMSLIIIVLFGLLVLWSLAGFILSMVGFMLGIKADSMVFSLFKNLGGPMGGPMSGPMSRPGFDGNIDRKQEKEMLKSMSPEERHMYRAQKKALKKIMSEPLHFVYEVPFHVSDVEYTDEGMRLELRSDHYSMNLGVITKNKVDTKVGDIVLCRMSDSPDTDIYGPLEGDIEMNGILKQTKRFSYLFRSDDTDDCFSIVTEKPVEMMKRVEQNKRYFIILAWMTEEEVIEHDQMMAERAEELNRMAGVPMFGYDKSEDELDGPSEVIG